MSVLGKAIDGPEMQLLASKIPEPPERITNMHFPGYVILQFKSAGVALLSNYGRIDQFNLHTQRYKDFETYRGELPRDLTMNDSISDVQEKLGSGATFGRRYPVGAVSDDPRAYNADYFLVDYGISYAVCICFAENKYVVQVLVVLANEK